MSQAIDRLVAAQKHAMQIRPEVGGFPVLAETLRMAGVTKNIWSLPSCQSIYLTELGPVIIPGTPLITTASDIPHFHQEALIRALRENQAGKSTFPEFLHAAWKAGVVEYIVEFEKRIVIYYGAHREEYIEAYPAV